MTTATKVPYNMFDIGTRVWLKNTQAVGEVSERWWAKNEDGKRQAHYRVKVRTSKHWEDPVFIEVEAKTGELRAADFCCDGCDRWLPNGSLEGRTEDIALCFLCANRSSRAVQKILRDELEAQYYDPEYERAQASEEWERRHGGGL